MPKVSKGGKTNKTREVKAAQAVPPQPSKVRTLSEPYLADDIVKMAGVDGDIYRVVASCRDGVVRFRDGTDTLAINVALVREMGKSVPNATSVPKPPVPQNDRSAALAAVERAHASPEQLPVKARTMKLIAKYGDRCAMIAVDVGNERTLYHVIRSEHSKPGNDIFTFAKVCGSVRGVLVSPGYNVVVRNASKKWGTCNCLSHKADDPCRHVCAAATLMNNGDM
jgi:hypothetical protein